MLKWSDQCVVRYAVHSDKPLRRRACNGGADGNPGSSPSDQWASISRCHDKQCWSKSLPQSLFSFSKRHPDHSIVGAVFALSEKSRKLHIRPAALRMEAVASEEHGHSDDITRLAINCSECRTTTTKVARVTPPHRVQGRHQVRYVGNAYQA